MSNKAHLRPHQKKRQASRTTGLLLVILLIALIALATAMVASGHAMPAGRIIPLHGGRRTVGGRLQFDTVRCRIGRTDQERWSSLNRFGQLRPELLMRLGLGSHTNERPYDSPDRHGQGVRVRPRLQTDLNGTGRPYWDLRIKVEDSSPSECPRSKADYLQATGTSCVSRTGAKVRQ